MRTRFFDATVYRTTSGHGETTAGITFRPTPNMTAEDIRQLVLDLARLSIELKQVPTLGEPAL